ncbi:MAG: helical backbone metal receptor [Bacteroidota bacterium]
MFLSPDQLSELDAPKRRIVSVVPSQTELLYDLGLDEEVVGITKFCIHPKHWFNTKTRIGGTKKLNMERIHALQPDLIIANKEENTQAEIEELARHFPVYMSDIFTLDDAFAMMETIGKLTGKSNEAAALIETTRTRFAELVPDTIPRRVLYLIWRGPYMAAGTNTFINSMLQQCGWINVLDTKILGKDLSRYPELSTDELSVLEPEVILLSSEPYPFKQQHIEELQALHPKAQILLVDGELFSWYGSRLTFSVHHFRAVLERLRYFHHV